MYWVCGLRLGTNFEAWPSADKNFYLRVMVEKKRAFAVSTDKYLRRCCCAGINFTALVNCIYQKTKIKCEIIKIHHCNTHLVRNKANISPLSATISFVCLQLIDFLNYIVQCSNFFN